MLENINWSGVLQSITDTWLPLLGVIFAIVVASILFKIFKIRNNK